MATIQTFDHTYMAAVERLLERRGVTLEAFCAEAGINSSTWRRWRADTYEPRQSRVRGVQAAVAKLKAGGIRGC